MSAATAPRLLAVSAACLLCAHGPASANASPDATLLRLRQGGEVSCRPALPYFCENVHVQCSGRTSEPAPAFALRGTDGAAPVALEAASQELRSRYRGARVEWDGDGRHLLLSPREAHGYVKLLADGKYVLRHYIGSRGVMSLGSCR